MAATRKSAKRRAAKKRGAAKRPSSKKEPATRKSASKRRAKKSSASKAIGLKRHARKGLRAARGGLDTVLQAGEKTWETLKTTTASVMEGVVEGVKETFAGDQRERSKRSNSR
jgi:hypothetical protein